MDTKKPKADTGHTLSRSQWQNAASPHQKPACFHKACQRLCTIKGPVSEQLCHAEMKRISMVAWEHLVARCRGGPEFGPSDVCTVCLMDMLDAVASADEQGQAREGALAIAEGLDEQETNSASVSYGYYVSKTWLQ